MCSMGRYPLFLFTSDQNSLDFVERHFFVPAVVELCRLGAGVDGHGRGFFEHTKIGGVRFAFHAR